MKQQYNLYLSDRAWESLVLKARTDGWVRGDRVWGMSKWMVGLLLANPTPDLWSDARPKWALEMSLSELEFGRFPVWDESDSRRPRALLLPEEAKLFTASLALKLGVVKAGGKGLRTTTLVSEFWEAVGIEWLVSTNRPPNPNYRRRTQSKKEEWDWTR